MASLEGLVLDGLALNGTSGGFTPASLTGLELWLKPETLGAGGSAISSWSDSSGLGNNAAQGTGASQPLVAASVLDGFKGALFDGADDYLTVAGITSSDATRTIFAVGKQSANAANETLAAFSSTARAVVNVSGQWGYFSTEAAAEKQYGSDPAAGFAAVTTRWNSAASADGYVNGGAAQNFNPSDGYQTGGVALHLGNNSSLAGGTAWTGHLVELIVFNSALSDADKDKVLGYLSAKYPTLGAFGTAPSGTEMLLTDLKFTPAKRRPEWAEPDDGDGALLVRDPKFTNSQWDLTVEVRGASRDAGHVGVGAITDKLVEASKKPLGIPLVHTPADSSDSTTWYVLMGEVNEIPVTWESGYFSTPPVLAVNLTLTSRPFGYEAEVTVSAAAGAGPLQIVSLPNVSGDVEAEARLVITDTATQSRDFAAWGLEWLYQAGADLLLTQPDLTATGFAGTSTTRSGSVSTNIYRGTLTTSPVAVCGTSNQPHVGTFRPYLRCYPTSTGIRVRFTYREGDGPLKSLEWETPVAANAWNELDLGVITVPEKLLGTQRWIGQIEAYSSVVGDTLDVDYLALMPCGEGFGRARRGLTFETSATFTDRDEFNQTAGSLAGKTSSGAKVWAEAGDAVRFTVETTGTTAQRTEVSDADDVTGAYAVSGATAFAAQVAQVDVKISTLAASDATPARRQYMGALARYTDVNNWLMAVVMPVDVGVGHELRVIKRVAGAAVIVDAVPLATFAAAVPWSVRLQPDAAGRWFAWAFKAGTQAGDTPLLQGYDTVLATGGALATGKPGFYDVHTSATAATRNYDNFVAFAPAAKAVCFSGQSIEFRSDDTIGEDSTGTYWGRPSEYRGAPFFIPPAGDENRTSRVAVMMRRNDIYTMPEANVTDNETVEVRYTPRRLHLPR